MNKSTHFSGQPTFVQIIRLLPKDVVAQVITRHNADFGVKKFNTWSHLLTMIFSCCANCESLREIVTGMRAMGGKLNNCSLSSLPARSTLSDANASRGEKVFGDLYFGLKEYFDRIFPDSRSKKDSVYVIDSTTIRLFQEVFKGAGMRGADGRRKGGLKVHMAVQESNSTASIVHLSAAANNDNIFIKHLNFPEGSTVIMDMGYRNFKQFNQWTRENVIWVTRLHRYTTFHVKSRNKVNRNQKRSGVISDAIIRMGAKESKAEKVVCRRIRFKSPETNKTFCFITNDLTSKASDIAATYKKRWSIELLFKRLKQNMPLKSFLGDNQNAIKIQIWCALITDLLFQVVKRQVKRSWAFSNLVKLVRLHLYNYLNLISFLENPERSLVRTSASEYQLALKLSG
ncbi:MAG TPA: IS4 family transposase [Cyclobacteriaceae bacterium]